MTVRGFDERALDAAIPADDGRANWKTLTYYVSQAGLDNSQVRLIVEADTDASAENIFVDGSRFLDAASPTSSQQYGTVTQVEFFVSTDGGQGFTSLGIDDDGGDGFQVDYVAAAAGEHPFHSQARDDSSLTEMAPFISDFTALVAAAPPAPTNQVPFVPLAVLLGLGAALGGRGAFNARCRRGRVSA